MLSLRPTSRADAVTRQAQGLASEPAGGRRDGRWSCKVCLSHHNGWVSIPPEIRYARNGAIHLSDPRSDNIPAMRAARVNRTEWLQG